MSYTFTPTALAEVLLLEPQLRIEDGGIFHESFNARDFIQATGFKNGFVQEGHLKYRYGVIRSPHYQVHHQQGKLVRVNVGEVFHAVVDMRRYSPSFGAWVGMLLSAANQQQLWIPQGFAHGYAVLSGTAEISIKSTDYLYPEHECRVRWDDPAIGIGWPAIGTPLVSPKDRSAPLLADAPAFMENRQLARQRWGVQRQFCAPVQVAPRPWAPGVGGRG